jgi:hypothetical protein
MNDIIVIEGSKLYPIIFVLLLLFFGIGFGAGYVYRAIETGQYSINWKFEVKQ